MQLTNVCHQEKIHRPLQEMIEVVLISMPTHTHETQIIPRYNNMVSRKPADKAKFYPSPPANIIVGGIFFQN